MSWLYLPGDPVLRGHAADIERELRHHLRPPGEEDPYALDEPPEARETERSEEPAFVPVAADVSPQMALFGAPAPAAGVVAAYVPPAFSPAVPEPEPEPEPELAAFERRALLRDKRHRLVSDLRRNDGRSHAEINRWLNRSCGIQRVDEASIEQLERSVELLLGALSRRSTARR
jgi:hypothetical protein